jgi:hypothetical protein
MTNPCGRLFHDPRQMRERSGRSHKESQNVPTAGICQEFDPLKRIDGFNFSHFD